MRSYENRVASSIAFSNSANSNALIEVFASKTIAEAIIVVDKGPCLAMHAAAVAISHAQRLFTRRDVLFCYSTRFGRKEPARRLSKRLSNKLFDNKSVLASISMSMPSPDTHKMPSELKYVLPIRRSSAGDCPSHFIRPPPGTRADLLSDERWLRL